jgi:hypothetical protein
VLFAGIETLGEIFQPWPRSRAHSAPVPSVARPPAPGSPVGFSALIERLFAWVSWVRELRGNMRISDFRFQISDFRLPEAATLKSEI